MQICHEIRYCFWQNFAESVAAPKKKKWSCDQDGGLHECDAPPAGLAALAGDADLDMAEKALLRSEKGAVGSGRNRFGGSSSGFLGLAIFIQLFLWLPARIVAK